MVGAGFRGLVLELWLGIGGPTGVGRLNVYVGLLI